MMEILKSSFYKREPLFGNSDTNCFRIFNSLADGIDGLAIDLYGEYLLIQYYRKEVRSLIMDSMRFASDLEKALSSLPVNIRGIMLKNRMKVSGSFIQEYRKSLLIQGEAPPLDYSVRENGVKAMVDLAEGQNTGIFPDMREVRGWLQSFYSENNISDILNLFCYTSIFSVHAIKNGARHTLNIDLSRNVLQRARSNYRLNGLPVDERDFIYGDAGKWVKILKKKGGNFNFVIFDPPTFSRNRKKTFSIKDNFRESLVHIEAIVPDGFILTSINSLSVSRDEFLSYHPEGWELVRFFNESSDFLNKDEPYLKVGIWHCGKG